MRNIKYIIAIALLIPALAWAQSEEQVQQNPEARKKIEAARIALITDRLGLTPEQAERFWPIYREFTQQRSALVREFREAQRNVGPDNTDAQKQQELLEMGMKIKQRELDLERDYSKRMMDVISARQVMDLRNAEKEFQRMIINQIQQRRAIQQRRENFRDRNQQLRDRKNNDLNN